MRSLLCSLCCLFFLVLFCSEGCDSSDVGCGGGELSKQHGARAGSNPARGWLSRCSPGLGDAQSKKTGRSGYPEHKVASRRRLLSLCCGGCSGFLCLARPGPLPCAVLLMSKEAVVATVAGRCGATLHF